MLLLSFNFLPPDHAEEAEWAELPARRPEFFEHELSFFFKRLNESRCNLFKSSRQMMSRSGLVGVLPVRVELSLCAALVYLHLSKFMHPMA